MSDVMRHTTQHQQTGGSVSDIAATRQRRDLAQRFAECRALGHEWRKRPPLGIDDQHDKWRRPFGASTGMIGIPSHCSTCGTDKIRWITRSGESITRYDHPDGYSRHGDDRLTAQQWRHTYVETVFESFERAAAPRARRA